MHLHCCARSFMAWMRLEMGGNDGRDCGGWSMATEKKLR